MADNIKQIKLKDGDMGRNTFEDALQELIGRHGLTTLANSIGMDKAELSRFKNGAGNISLENLNAIFKFGKVTIVFEDDWDMLLRMRVFDGKLLGMELKR